MKKTNKTRLTALMFAAAGVGCMMTGADEALPGIKPTEAAAAEAPAAVTAETATAECTTAAAIRALKALYAKGTNLKVTASGELKGDVNANGELEVRDIIALQKYLLGNKIKINSQNSDMNGDNVLDIFDLALLKRAVIEQQDGPQKSDPTEPETETDTTMPQPVYGPPEWFTETTEDLTTTEPQDVYGPPNWFEDPTDTSDPTEPETTIPQAVYGPPTWLDETTEPQDTDPTETPETTMETLYGPPNIWYN